jgi:hypothetical protein
MFDTKLAPAALPGRWAEDVISELLDHPVPFMRIEIAAVVLRRLLEARERYLRELIALVEEERRQLKAKKKRSARKAKRKARSGA